MNRVESYEELKKMLIICLEQGRTLAFEGEDKEFLFELLEFCREKINK